MKGWHGKILRINLTSQTVATEDVDPKIAKDFIGGRGWAIKYLTDEVDPKVDPLGPDNNLIFATGPLTSTPAPTGNRYMVVTKSPLTGALTNSNSGGDFPTWMKRTGFDMYIFEGRAEQPVYLWVNEDEVEIRSAAHVWGKDVHETTEILLAETDAKARVACIGPAGERLVKMAAIINDKHRAAGRSGVGAVMGSKNLKAVVAQGKKDPILADVAGAKALGRKMTIEVGTDAKKSAMREFGTSYVPDVTNELGILPTYNSKTGVFEGASSINGPTLNEKYLIRPTPCYKCPLSCGRLTEVNDEGFEGKGEGPEYETIASFGSACGVDNLGAVTKANYLCNELGLDTISMGMTIACAMEMYEDGVIPEEKIGRPLKFGDAEAMVDMVRMTAYREGFGDALAEGSYRLAESYGHPDYSITAKKQEFPGYDPRGSKGMGLLYATSNIGASHMSGDVAYTEVFGVPQKTDSLTTDGKAELVMLYEDAFVLIDATGVCVFVSVRYFFNGQVYLLPTRLAEMMNLVTGSDYTPETLLKAGERVFNLERMFLIGAGFTQADDTLPKRILEEPLPAGPAKGHVAELDKMLPEFYEVRGWDENGVPTPEKLQELGLK